MTDKTIDTLDAQGMVDQANALLDRVSELQTENARLKQHNTEYHAAMMEGHEKVQELSSRLGAAQARIDALMLEYCPDEMTDEQTDEWANHQYVAGDDRALEDHCPMCEQPLGQHTAVCGRQPVLLTDILTADEDRGLQCREPHCELPLGHAGPHTDDEGSKWQTPAEAERGPPKLSDLLPKPGEKCSGPSRARLRKAQESDAERQGRCASTFGVYECQQPAGHTGLHHGQGWAWGQESAVERRGP